MLFSSVTVHRILALRTLYSQAYAATGDCSRSDFTVMVTQQMDAVIHFRHAPEEVVDLELATIPMMECVKRVSTWQTRLSLKRILEGEFFRAREATSVKNMLLRAAKYSRAHLDEYFPLMRQDTLIQAQALEDAINRYWANFQRLREEALPIH